MTHKSNDEHTTKKDNLNQESEVKVDNQENSTSNQDAVINNQTESANNKKKPQTHKKENVSTKKTKTNQEKIEKLKQERDQYLDLAKRVKAEFENYKKRSELNFNAQVAYQQHNLIKEFLAIYDNLERAVTAAEKTKNFEDFDKGIQLISKQFKETLKKFGVEEISVLGEEFDPNLHEAMMMQKSDDVEKEIVAQVYEKGYKLDGKVVRHAKVIVNKPKSKNDSENQKTESEK